ncbi:hypothetical protein MNBD_NITROSPINAE01-154 [hydrothermal vent metagenome]|uniref:GerMN domain-containing protein n=1 Tax=hydrothermal vent metagenome TaxID=652676 RepID=A0A3B1C4G5_9ZZZZ
MKTGYTGWILGLFTIFVIVALLPGPDGKELLKEGKKVSLQSLTPELEKHEAVFYFADKNYTGLEKVTVEVESGSELENRIKATIAKFFTDAQFPLFPNDTTLSEVFVVGATAVISLDSGFRRKFNGGVWTETLAITSLVNTVVESFEAIDSVKVLIDDKETELFVAHVRIVNNLHADESLTLEEVKEDEEEPADSENEKDMQETSVI